jgi:aryl-alcohol dehydrogenase-like predicted oxidoreductase
VLVDWKAHGRIGAIGIGVRQPEFHQRAIETGEMDIVLTYLDYTLLSQSAAEAIIPMAMKSDVGILLGSPLGGSMLAGPEPELQGSDGLDLNQGEPLPPAVVGSTFDPNVIPRAHRMWEWCNQRGLNIRDLAMQFVLNAPLKGNGIVLSGPANPKEFDEVYASATTEVPESAWQEFEAEFGIRA